MSIVRFTGYNLVVDKIRSGGTRRKNVTNFFHGKRVKFLRFKIKDAVVLEQSFRAIKP